jgi:outer membrane lipoprotein-sorting protein
MVRADWHETAPARTLGARLGTGKPMSKIPRSQRSSMMASATIGLSLALALIGPRVANAQTTGTQPAPAWTATTVNRAPGTTAVVLDEKQTAAVKDVGKYFNDLKQLKGVFNQTNADGKRMRGKFLIKQPGKFRFDYASGSKMIIVSDGKMLSIQDLDLKTDSSWELDRTPFRILLRKDVDLLRDASILEVQDVDDLIILSLQDKNPDTVGRIKLFLGKKPNLELKEWVTTDPQGIDTRIEISELNKTEEIANDLFSPVSPEILKLQQKQ